MIPAGLLLVLFAGGVFVLPHVSRRLTPQAEARFTAAAGSAAAVIILISIGSYA